LKIKDVRVSVHRFETVLPIINRPGPAETRVICEIETDNGYVGVGMTARFLCHAVAEAVRHYIAPALKDMDPRDLEAIHARLSAILSERGVTNGVNRMALSCVDLALWDLIGLSGHRTVAELLGGFRDRADVYVTFGYFTYEADALVEFGRALVAQGHSRFKMLVGSKEGLRVDVARVRAMRDGLGDDVAIAIDANESLSGHQATQLCGLLEDQDIAWFEDPLLNNDPRDLAAMRSRTSIPVAAGQMDGDGRRFREFIEHDALDIFMPNSMYNGGMTETMRVAHLSQIYNRPLSDAGGGEFTVFTTWPAFATARWRNGMSAPSRSSGSFLSTLRRRMADSFGSHQLQGSASGSTETRSRKRLSERKPDKRLHTRQRTRTATQGDKECSLRRQVRDRATPAERYLWACCASGSSSVSARRRRLLMS